MTEAEFERRLNTQSGTADTPTASASSSDSGDPTAGTESESTGRSSTTTSRSRASRSKPAKPRRVQRMFAIEEEVDKKLWLYAIHIGKDRSEVVNDLLRPVVASMVLYDSRERRGGRNSDTSSDRGGDDGDSPN
jgi:hypothetical protein